MDQNIANRLEEAAGYIDSASIRQLEIIRCKVRMEIVLAKLDSMVEANRLNLANFTASLMSDTVPYYIPKYSEEEIITESNSLNAIYQDLLAIQ